MSELKELEIKLPQRSPKQSPAAYIDELDEFGERYKRLGKICKTARLVAEFCKTLPPKQPFIAAEHLYKLLCHNVTRTEFDMILKSLDLWGILTVIWHHNTGVTMIRWEAKDEV